MTIRTLGVGTAFCLALAQLAAADDPVAGAARLAPEPSTLLLFSLGVGLVGAALLRGRRSR